MITKFKEYNNIEVNINLPQDILSSITNTLSFIVYKGSKRDELKHKNFKSLRIKSIGGYYNQNKLNHKEITSDCLFSIEMTNKDKIEAKYSRKSDTDNLLENSIYVEINGEQVYHLDNESYDINSFIQMIGTQYKKYIEKKQWKIK